MELGQRSWRYPIPTRWSALTHVAVATNEAAALAAPTANTQPLLNNIGDSVGQAEHESSDQNGVGHFRTSQKAYPPKHPAAPSAMTNKVDDDAERFRSNLWARMAFAMKTKGPKKLKAVVVKRTNAMPGASGSRPGISAIENSADTPMQSASTRVATAAGHIKRATRTLTFLTPSNGPKLTGLAPRAGKSSTRDPQDCGDKSGAAPS